MRNVHLQFSGPPDIFLPILNAWLTGTVAPAVASFKVFFNWAGLFLVSFLDAWLTRTVAPAVASFERLFARKRR